MKTPKFFSSLAFWLAFGILWAILTNVVISWAFPLPCSTFYSPTDRLGVILGTVSTIGGFLPFGFLVALWFTLKSGDDVEAHETDRGEVG